MQKSLPSGSSIQVWSSNDCFTVAPSATSRSTSAGRSAASDVEVDGYLRSALELHLLEADLEVRALDDDDRVGLGGQPERGEPRDLRVVIRAEVEVVERGGPEAGK